MGRKITGNAQIIPADRDRRRDSGSTNKTDQASIHKSSLFQAVGRVNQLTGWFSLLCLLETGGNECL